MRPICSVNGCDRQINSARLGLCSMHQRRLERHGNVEITNTPNTRQRGFCIFKKIDDDTAIIPLTKGFKAIVDLEDVERLCKHNWYADIDSKGYVRARAKINGKTVNMQEFLISFKDGFIIDHKNRHSLDNRKSNLRHVTYSRNTINSDRSDNAVGYTYNKLENKWKAYTIGTGGKSHLGTFATREEAEKAVLLSKKAE